MSDQAPAMNQLMPVQDLSQFVHVLVSWHTRQVNTLKHFQDIPEGSVMESGDKSVTLTGDVLVGFKAGIEMALMELGTLPFMVEYEAQAANEASSEPASEAEPS